MGPVSRLASKAPSSDVAASEAGQVTVIDLGETESFPLTIYLEDDCQMITKTDRGAGEHPIIVFDALCVLCSMNAQFVLKYDRRGYFRLASMQGAVGSDLCRRCGVDPANPETLIVVSGASALRDSEAVLAIWSGLGWPWRALTALRLAPQPLRDHAYRWIARNRYRIFGRREKCWAPTPEQAIRIL